MSESSFYKELFLMYEAKKQRQKPLPFSEPAKFDAEYCFHQGESQDEATHQLPLRIKICGCLSFHFSFLLKNLKEGPLIRSRSITLLEVPGFRPTLPGTLSPVGPTLWVLAKLPDADTPFSVVSSISIHRSRDPSSTVKSYNFSGTH